MKDLITAATTGLFVEVGKVIEHMKAQQARIADLERQLAEASAPAVEQQPVAKEKRPEDFGCMLDYANYISRVRSAAWDVINRWDSPLWKTEPTADFIKSLRDAVSAAPPAADTDKVREALSELVQWLEVGDAEASFLDKARAALASTMAAQAPVREVPEGWKLVPVEPTEAMLDAIEDAAKAECSIEWDSLLGGNLHFGDPSRVYADMLAAAPLPASPVQQEGDRG